MERGIVREIRGNKAYVEFRTQDACATCSTKIFCSPSAGSERRVLALNSAGANVGDTVDVDQSELSEIRMAFIQYGIPLAGFVGAVSAASAIPSGYIDILNLPKELIWFAAGVAGLFFGGFLSNRYAEFLARAGIPAFKIINVLKY